MSPDGVSDEEKRILRGGLYMMDMFSLNDLISQLRQLPPDQLKMVINSASEDIVRDRIEKDNGLLKTSDGDIISCPHCGSVEVWKHSNNGKKSRYKCKDCKKTFTLTTSTFFENSHLEEWQWRGIKHEVVPADKHRNGTFNLGRVNSFHGNYKSHYSKGKRNLPAMKYLNIGTDLFWWLEKHRDLSTQQKVDLIFNMLNQEKEAITKQEIQHRKLNLDVKGAIADKGV